MADTSPTLPGTGANDTAVGTTSWTSPTNIQGDDTNYATSAGTGGAESNYLKGTNFGFSIPSGATINGIQVAVERFSNQNGSLRYTQDSVLKLVKGGSVVGDSKAATATKWPTSQASVTYGSTSDLWGTTLSDTDVNASNFGVVLSVKNYGGVGATASVDCFKVTITYTASGGSGVPKQQTHYARMRRN